ncbi:hypothetical protein [Streptomyces sp. NPDC050704]|uniref:hypothetical protein n=1 Tax=Streptomyces sp. NPDC050704 TaxID=3157219 RepID=UPI003449282C
MPERHGPDGTPNGAAVNPPALDDLLATAVRAHAIDPVAEGRALAAFRAARDEGVHGAAARTRRRDDWRAAKERRGRWSLRATLAALLASVTLGGVAVAAIGTGDGTPDERRDSRTQNSAPARSAPDAAPTPAPGSATPGRGGGPSDRPSSAQDTEARCRAYDSVKDRGKALDSTAWQRLVQAAGGAGNVEAYCAGQLKPTEKPDGNPTERPDGNPGQGETGAAAGPSKPAKPSQAPGKAPDTVPDKGPAKNSNAR